MFQADGVCSVKIIDWQLARYCSPIFDLFFNLFSVTTKELRDKHFNYLINLYYASLSTTIRKLGSDPDQLFSYADFQRESQKLGIIFLIYAPFTLQFVIADPDDLHDIEEYNQRISNGETLNIIKEFQREKQALYNQATRDIVNDLFAYGFING